MIYTYEQLESLERTLGIPDKQLSSQNTKFLTLKFLQVSFSPRWGSRGRHFWCL